MAKKLTKTQAKRAWLAILQKSKRLWADTGMLYGMPTKDYTTIENIVKRNMKRL